MATHHSGNNRLIPSRVGALLFTAVGFLFIAGCFPRMNQYRHMAYQFDLPDTTRYQLKGLEAGDTILEMTDYNGTEWASGKELFVVIGRKSGESSAMNRMLGSFNMESGTVTGLRPIVYDWYKPLYWTKLVEDDPDRHDQRGFLAEKIAWGDENRRVVISKQKGGYATQKYVLGDSVLTLERYEGVAQMFDLDGNVHWIRYYPVDDHTYVSFQPFFYDDGTEILGAFTYELRGLKSWGAEANIPLTEEEGFVDSGVSRDGSTVVLLTGSPGNYHFRRFASPALVKAIRTFRAASRG